MILPRHPDLLSDQELAEWVHRLVTLKTPESIFLDYKATVTTSSPSDRREIAKDISSFANERGGVVLYGIPETRQDGVPVPVNVDSVGMDPVSGFPENIENILIDSLVPRLPELRIHKILLATPPGKVVYLVWHPESWEAPHMIHSYKENRYYRRGNFRAVPMEEGEIERLYLRRQTRRTLAEQFLKETDFGESLLSTDKPMMRLVVCPSFPFEDRVDFSREIMRNWLRKNMLSTNSEWLPFVLGVHSATPVVVSEQQIDYLTETRLFRCGAASFCSAFLKVEGKKFSGRRFQNQLDKFLQLVGRFYEQIGMTGNALIDVTLLNMMGVEFDARVNRRLPDFVDHLCRSDTLQFRVPMSVVDLLTEDSRWALERRVMDRLTQCFGEWTIPEYFKEDGSPR